MRDVTLDWSSTSQRHNAQRKFKHSESRVPKIETRGATNRSISTCDVFIRWRFKSSWEKTEDLAAGWSSASKELLLKGHSTEKQRTYVVFYLIDSILFYGYSMCTSTALPLRRQCVLHPQKPICVMFIYWQKSSVRDLLQEFLQERNILFPFFTLNHWNTAPPISETGIFYTCFSIQNK